MFKRLSLVLVTFVLLLSSCGGSNEEAQTATTTRAGEKLSVVATTPIVSDFVRIIGGDRVEVHEAIKPAVDPHDYEPTAADITALARADLIFRNGVGLEDWFENAVDSAESQATVVDTSDGVPLRKTPGSTEDDPHVWHSPLNAKIMVGNVRRALERRDPQSATMFQGNERAYSAQLDALVADIRRLIDPLPDKKVVTSHDSIGYFLDEFGLAYVGSVLPTFDTQAELSSAQISELVAKIRAENVRAVFAEQSLPPATAKTVAREADVKVVDGDDAIYGDTLGAPGSDADTYLKMERHNANVIASNLR